MQKSYSLQELATKVGGTLRGNADVVVNNIAALSKAEPNQLTFISNAKFRPLLAESKAGILVVSEADVEFCYLKVIYLSLKILMLLMQY